MSYPTFETKYGQPGSATAQPGPAPLGAAGADPVVADGQENPWAQIPTQEEQVNPWSQKLDPWAIEAQNQPAPTAQGGKK